MKQCSKCSELKEKSDFRKKHNQCKDCIKKHDRQYYFKYKKERKQYALYHTKEKKQNDKQYYLNNAEEIKQRMKQYRKSNSGKLAKKKCRAKRRKMKYMLLINNPFPEDIIVEDHHILNNFHAIDAEGSWNKWFVVPMPKITHRFIAGASNSLEHWRHNEEWIRKLYDINIKELLGQSLKVE